MSGVAYFIEVFGMQMKSYWTLALSLLLRPNRRVDVELIITILFDTTEKIILMSLVPLSLYDWPGGYNIVVDIDLCLWKGYDLWGGVGVFLIDVCPLAFATFLGFYSLKQLLKL
ncbi:hypothetical protein ACJX0J_032087, partial [Zea mays]